MRTFLWCGGSIYIYIYTNQSTQSQIREKQNSLLCFKWDPIRNFEDYNFDNLFLSLSKLSLSWNLWGDRNRRQRETTGAVGAKSQYTKQMAPKLLSQFILAPQFKKMLFNLSNHGWSSTLVLLSKVKVHWTKARVCANSMSGEKCVQFFQ